MSPRLFDPGTEDIAPLAAIHATSFPEPWSAAAIRDLFATPGVFAFADPDGFILARAAAGEAEILTIAVSPPARRRGIGRILVRAAASHARKLGADTMFLEVATGNDAARRLYAGVGFTAAGLRKAYYGAEDAHILKANLPLPNPGEFA
jgi:ribosomal-protein-alanine N-acetyltransferase